MSTRLILSAVLFCCFQAFRGPAQAQVYEKVFSFADARAADLASPLNKGSFPWASLVEASDGNFYGTAQYGSTGAFTVIGNGVVFRMSRQGVVTTLVEFGGTGTNTLGRYTRAGLVQGSDGNFYGVTAQGGTTDRGTIFRMTPAGAITTLVQFSGNGATNKGSVPYADLLLASDGNFYGTTTSGGTSNAGTVFKMTPAGVLTTLVEFTGTSGLKRGKNSHGDLVEGTDGNFYGTTGEGGVSNFGTIFKLTPTGVFTTLVDFTDSGTFRGRAPLAGLVEGADGAFYGTADEGGVSNKGTVFKVTKAGLFTSLVEFTGTSGVTPGEFPYGGLLLASDGNFYGTTGSGGAGDGGTVFKMTPSGSLTILHEFNRDQGGRSPASELIEASDGFLYGTTRGGGVGDGTIYRISRTGEFTNLAEFIGPGLTHFGSGPGPGVVAGPDGNFYGVTSQGGIYNDGTLFRLSPAGDLATLVEFQSAGPMNKGHSPTGPLLLTGEGEFYGTTLLGGSGDGYGTVYKVSTSGELTTLTEFEGGISGEFVTGGLTRGPNGNYYGTTAFGGEGFNGTIFRITPAGARTTLVHYDDATAATQGGPPSPNLTLGNDGNFYGTTDAGGSSDLGIFFRLTSAGLYTPLLSFTGNGASNKGSGPNGGLAKATDGSFYGSTFGGGANDLGTIFRVTTDGTLTTLVQFTGNGATNKGARPNGGLLLGSDGFIYGTTSSGGAADLGTVFRMTPAGVLTTLFDFSADPAYGLPGGFLTFGPDGNLYGTAGRNDGAVFRLVFPGAPNIWISNLTQQSASATLNARVNARGAATTVTCEFGTDGVSFPLAAPVTPSSITGFRSTLVGSNLTGLEPGTTYFYRLRAVSSAGTTVTPVRNFSTLATPIAKILPASQIASNSVRFNGTVNPRNYDADVVFEWGTDGDNFPNIIAAQPAQATGNMPVPVSADLAGLTKGTQYSYRVRAVNAGGVAVSGTQSFITLAEPQVALGSATVLDARTVQVSGTVNARGAEASAAFEFGTAAGFPVGSTTSVGATPSPVSGADDTTVSASLANLMPGATYYYRLTANSAGGSTIGSGGTFATPSLPEVSNLAAPTPGSSTATLQAMVNGQGLSTTVTFEYGTAANSLPFSVSANPGTVNGDAPTTVSAAISGLLPETTVYFRVRATSAAGETVTSAFNFPTASAAKAVTGAAIATLESTTLSGTFNAFGQPTAVGFVYGTSAAQLDRSIAAGTGTLDGLVDAVLSSTLTDLTPGTRYFYRARAVNGGGTTLAQNVEFFDVPANEGPVANADVYFYFGQMRVEPMENDTDANNVPPVAPNSGLYLDGTLVIPPNASFAVASVDDQRFINYVPQFNSLDDDSLTYRVFDTKQASAEGVVRFIAFSKRAGLYGGKIVAGSGPGARIGKLAVQMTGGGVITTSFVNWPTANGDASESFILKGGFDQRGRLTRSFTSSGGVVLTLALQLDADLPQIQGTFEERVNGASTTGVLQFTLVRNAETGGLAASGLRTGFLDAPSGVAGMVPGFVRMTIGKNARRGARFAGRLPDGEPFLASAPAQGRTYELARKLELRGVFTGLVRAVDNSSGDGGILGDLFWKKPASSRATYHRDGIDTFLALAGISYPELGDDELPGGFSGTGANARLRLSGGGLPEIYRDILLNVAPRRVTVIGPDLSQSGADLSLDRLRVELSGPKAQLRGRFLHPVTRRAVKFDGALRMPFDGESVLGQGVFRGPGAAGEIRLEAIPAAN